MLKQGPNTLPQAKRVVKLLQGDNPWKTKIPFVLLTNGGGYPDDERRKTLSKNLDTELSPSQVIQSHTPLRKLAAEYADKDVLVLGGGRDAIRRVAHSYGLSKAWIPQDILAWRPSVWSKTDRDDYDNYVVKRDFSETRFAAIFAMADSHDWGRDSTIICELLRSDGGVLGTRGKDGGKEPAMPLYISNPDLEWQR